MNDPISTLFPLQEVSKQDLQELSRSVWNWTICQGCSSDMACANAGCSWSRAGRLEYFWTRYKRLTEAYIPELYVAKPALSSHLDLVNLIHSIRNQPNVIREELMRQNFPVADDAGVHSTALSDRNRAMNLAASITYQTNCGTSIECVDFLETDSSCLSWRNYLTAREYVAEAFPCHQHPYFDRASTAFSFSSVTSRLAGTQLVSNGFRFESTDDLRNHLKLDHEKRVVRVYHGTSVLKENLLASRETFDGCAMPRAIALEALDTIHNILFPADRGSYALLQSLVLKQGFDRDILHYEAAHYQRDDDANPTYEYFGSRLAEIYDEMQDPKPRGRLEHWLEGKTSTRYMLLVTLIGVLVAITLGFFTLCVGIFQAWIAYQQWKHPPKDS